MLRQVLQHLHFTPGEDHPGVAAVRAQIEHIDLEIGSQAQSRVRGLLRSSPPQHGLHPQHQLRDRKRLGHIVVGAQRQSAHDVLISRFGGQHDHRLLPILLAQASQHVKTIAPRQHHVQQDQIKSAAQRLFQASFSIRCRFHLVAVIDEDVDQTVANRDLVLDDQDAQLAAHDCQLW